MSDPIFPSTHWSVVLEAARAEPERARRAFEQLCGEYRAAIAHWMRLHRLRPEEAEDAAHDFLLQWLRRENPLQGFERGERRFSQYLRVCLRRFLQDWHAQRRAKRRQGDIEHIAWEHDELIGDGVDCYPWLDFTLATQIHRCVLAKLKRNWESKLAGERFDRLQTIALGEAANPGYAALATELRVSVGGLKAWMFRLRREYHDAFRDAVSQQTDPSLVEQDVVHLHNLVLNPPPGIEENVVRLQPRPPPSR